MAGEWGLSRRSGHLRGSGGLRLWCIRGVFAVRMRGREGEAHTKPIHTPAQMAFPDPRIRRLGDGDGEKRREGR